MKSSRVKILKFTLKTFTAAIAIVLLLLLLLRIPFVQTQIAQFALHKVSQLTNTKLHIDKIKINFIDNISLKGLYIEDTQEDTLLFANKLTINIALFKLLNKEVNIENISLKNGVVSIYQNADSTYNYQFLIDSFAGDNNDTTPSAFSFSIGKVAILETKVDFNTLEGNNHIEIGKLAIKADAIDFNTLDFKIKRIVLDHINGYSIWENSNTLSDAVEVNKNSVSFPLSALPIKISCKKISIKKSRFLYQNGKHSRQNYFNPNYILGEEINLAAKDLALDSNQLKLNISNLSLALNKHFTLKKMNSLFTFTNKTIDIERLLLETEKSYSTLAGKIDYSSFNDFVSFKGNLPLQLHIDSMNLAYADLAYFIPSLDTVSLPEAIKNETLVLKGEVNGSLDNLHIDNVLASLNDDNIELNGNIKGLPNYKKISFQNTTLKAKIKKETLRDLLQLNSRKNSNLSYIQLNTIVNGNFENLKIERLNIASDGDLAIDLNGNATHLLNTDSLAYTLNINLLESSYDDVNTFVDSLPVLLKKLGLIKYHGTLSGSIKNYKLTGDLETELGSAQSDLALAFNPNFSNAHYEGDVTLNEFLLGDLIDNDSIGALSLALNINGNGLNLDSLDTQLNAAISSFVFNSYSYKNININGEIAQRKFNGLFNIKDENIDFSFDGLVDFNEQLPQVKFKAFLNHLNTQKLNLSSYPIIASFSVDADLSGIQAKDIEGEVRFKDITIKNYKEQWHNDSIVFKAIKNSATNTSLSLASSVINGEMNGRYNLMEIGQILTTALDNYFPVSKFTQVDNFEAYPLSDEKIQLKVEIADPTKLLQIFKFPVSELDTAFINFNYFAQNNTIEASVDIPHIQYGQFNIFDFAFNSSGNGMTSDNNLTIDSTVIENIGYLPKTEIKALFKNNVGAISLNINEQKNFWVQSTIENEDSLFTLQIDKPIIINKKQWDFTQSSPLILNKSLNKLPSIELSKHQEKITLTQNQDNYTISVSEFDIRNITQIMELDSFDLRAYVNGDVNFSAKEQGSLTSNILVKKLALNGSKLGDLSLNVEKENEIINASVDLDGSSNEISMHATYNSLSKLINANIDVTQFNLHTLNPFFREVATNIKGQLKGDFKINGPVKKLDTQGNLSLVNTSAFIVPLGSVYTISKGTISLSGNEIAPNITFKDTIGREARLSGKLRHRNFSDLTLDLDFNAPGFTFLNSKESKDLPFFGYFNAAVDLAIKGDVNMPKVLGELSVNKSDVTIQLLDQKAMAAQENYVIFIDGGDFTYEELDSIANKNYTLNTSIDLNVKVKLDNDASFNIIIDPLTGDNLRFKGVGDLAVKLPPSGDVDITGIYEISEGSYRFSFQKILKKNFLFTKNSKITFAGDPMNAILDIHALYKTQATTLALVQNELSALSDEELQNYKRKSDIDVLLNIDGKLSNPNLNFDIQLPNDGSSALNSAAKRSLDRLKENESELNKQVFSLLLFNGFTSSTGSSNISPTGTGTAVKSVSNLINTQLNKLTKNAKGLDLNFNLDQYEDKLSETGEQITDIEFGLSQSLLDDKLVISLDGNVGLDSGNDDGSLSNIAGNFVLRYKITKDGKYNVRVFQKSDYDALNDANVWKTGAGFSYQTSFGRIRKNKNDKK